jgi:hypothetical protein
MSTTSVANYNRSAIPSTVLNRLESLIVFLIVLWAKLHGSITVVEVAGGQPVPAFQSGGAFQATDNFTYLSMRIRLRVDPDWASNSLPLWNSMLHTASEVVAIPTLFGGV